MFTSTSTAPLSYYPFGMIMPGRSGNDTIPACDTTVTVLDSMQVDCDTLIVPVQDTILYNDFTDDPGNSVPSVQGWSGSVSPSGGGLFITNAPNGASPSVLLHQGKTYTLTVDVNIVTPLNVIIGFGPTFPGSPAPMTITSAGTASVTFTVGGALGSTYTSKVFVDPTTSCVIDNFLLYRHNTVTVIDCDTTIVPYDTLVEVNCPRCGQGYRYAFNGMERDDEVKDDGNSLDFGARIYDPRLGRFLSVDPFRYVTPFMSPYSFAWNEPIWAIDANGEIKIIVITHETQLDGTVVIYRTVFDVQTGEDIAGIQRSDVIVHRYTKLENHDNGGVVWITSILVGYHISNNTGETAGERMKRENPLGYYWMKFATRIWGPGLIAMAFQDRDPFTGEYRDAVDRILDGVDGVLSIVTLGRSTMLKGGLKKWVKKQAAGWAIEFAVLTMLDALEITDADQQAVFTAYVSKLMYEKATGKIDDLFTLLTSMAKVGTKGAKAIQELKDKQGIDLNMPANKEDAVKSKILDDPGRYGELQPLQGN